MESNFSRTLDHVVAFLRMSAIELRHVARRAPEIADQLRYIADQLDAEADGLSQRNLC
jgi:hypothetical protein